MEYKVKNSQYRRFNEQENRVEYRQVLSVRNSSTNADKTILVVTVDGVVLGGDGPASFRTHGGQLRVANRGGKHEEEEGGEEHGQGVLGDGGQQQGDSKEGDRSEFSYFFSTISSTQL